MGAYYVDTGAMEVGSLVANSQYISMVLTSVMMLSLVIMMFPTSYACAKRIAEVLETESTIRDGSYPVQDRPRVLRWSSAMLPLPTQVQMNPS